MTKSTDPIKFKAKLSRPATPKGAAWTFLVLPAAASKKLPKRSMVTVDGTLAGQTFEATLEPDGQGSHWLKVEQVNTRNVACSVNSRYRRNLLMLYR